MRRPRGFNTLSSVEQYRERIRALVDELDKGPDYDAAGGDPRVAIQTYRVRLDYLNAISKAAIADKQLEDMAGLQRKVRELEALLEDRQQVGANARHHQRARLACDPPVGEVLTDEPIH